MHKKSPATTIHAETTTGTAIFMASDEVPDVTDGVPVEGVMVVVEGVMVAVPVMVADDVVPVGDVLAGIKLDSHV